MTQTDVGTDLLGYVGPSVSNVAPGGTFAIPYPANAPQQCNFVVVANSSPYTISVSQGQLLGQVAAFTSDVYPIRSGQPLGIAPQQTAGQVAAGSDTTVYTTWFLQRPNGSYPAAIGSSGTALQVADTFFSDNSGSAIPSGNQRLYGPANCAGYASTRFALAEVSGTGPLIFTLGWIFATGRISRREIVLPPAGICEIVTPNLADFVQVLVTNNTALNTPAPEVEVIGQTQAVSAFNADAVPHGIISKGGPLVIANGAHNTASDLPTFPGPASLSVYSTVASGGLGWTVALNGDVAGDHTYSSPLYTFGSVGAAPGNFTIPPGAGQIILPPVPTQLVITNALGGNSTFSWSLIADAFRVG